ncbi:hypothetical protein PTKIN_Ptkin13bG0276800 [Pterospermum kingtungense]
MDKTFHISQRTSTHGEQDNQDLLSLSLSSGHKPSSSAAAPPVSLPLGLQTVQQEPPPPSPLGLQNLQQEPRVSSPLMGLQMIQPSCLLLTPNAPPLAPQTSFYQQILQIPQAPPLPLSYPNHQTHSPTDLNPNGNGVPQEVVSHSLPNLNPNDSGVSQEVVNHSHQSRARKNPDPKPKPGKTETIPPPFPWATSQRATVHSLDYLLSHNMTKISGEVQCKKCNKVNTIEYDLSQKFREIASFISENRFAMHCRAPSSWMNPKLPSCESCGRCTKPVVSKKRSINWLFLLLGGMLGCCKLSELKYFCKHSKNHRTGAKDRVLYLTYLGLCKQLDPKGPFDI